MQSQQLGNLFFVTGMIRSGTTLLAKLISRHPDALCFSDRYFNNFLSTKKEFLNTLGRKEYHTLFHYFPVSYHPEQFKAFLQQANFNLTYAGFFSNTHTAVKGCKEVLCEEFFSYLLDAGIKCLLIIRDPRDVISSIHTGAGEKFVGKHRPVIFDIRNWRKSIGFGIENSSHPNLMMVKYEDLVATPGVELCKIFGFLGLNQDENLISKLTSEVENTNSSYSEIGKGINEKSVRKYKSMLSAETIDFVAATAFPEMLWCGYNEGLPAKFNPSAINSYKDPFPLIRAEFKDWDHSLQLEKEIARMEELLIDKKRDVPLFWSHKILEELKLVLKNWIQLSN